MSINWDDITKNPSKNHKVLGSYLLQQKKKIDELEKKQKEFEEAKENINKMHDSMVSEIESKDKVIEDTKKELDNSNKKNESLQNTIIDQEKEISNLNSKNQGLEDKVQELETKVKESINLTVELGQKKSELEKSKSELQNYKDSETNFKNEIQKLKNSNSELRDELQKIKDAEEGQIKEITQYQEKVRELTSEIQNLRTELDSLKEKLPSKDDEEKLDNLRQEISNAKQTIEQNNNQIEELKQNIKDKEAEIENLKEAPTSAPVIEMLAVKGKEAAINTLQNILNEAKSKVLIVTPDIKYIQDLPFQDIREVIRIDVAANITDKNVYDHLMDIRPSLRVRDNPHIDRWGITIDNEKLFFAASIEEPIGFITTNRKMIDFINAILTESWVRAKRL